jgi:diguanylate cyclase (GGDEF)-like protein
VDWGKIPDLAAVTLLASAFAAVARRSQAPVSTLWLTGWLMIALHFAAFMFAPLPGQIGTVAVYMGITSLAWAGILFNWSSVPDRKNKSSLWMLGIMIGTNTAYLGLIVFNPEATLALSVAAYLFGALPLALALLNIRRENHPLRWTTVACYCALSAFLLKFQNRPGNGLELAINAVLFAIYIGCCIHFWFAYRRATSGAFVTIVGFFAWASVFVLAPGLNTFLPSLHLENEVWNLPKYVVAVGMILLLLEDQIEHNKYLALHDELTGLPNRRLFQDRLASSLERARRTGTQTALLLIDLDQFKLVNDTYGHHAGDLLLEHVGKVFSGRIRRSDTVARTGGDEFAVILGEPLSRADAEHVAHSLVELLNDPIELSGQMVRIGASVGTALFPDDATDAEGLCIAADLRMYDSKYKSGRYLNPARPLTVTSVPAIDPMPHMQRAD